MDRPELQRYDRIGGWLFLPLLGLLISPFYSIYFLYVNYWPIYSEGYWKALTTPTSESYHPLWAPLLIFEVVGNIGLLVLGLVALWYFLRLSYLTPWLMISLYALSLAFVAGDFYVADFIPVVAAEPDPEAVSALIRSVIAALIWIPYFLVSKRVKATFVN